MNSLARRPSVRQRLAHFREAVRGIWQGPIYSSDPNLREFFGTNVTSAGVPVSEGTALTYAAVWNAVNCISGDIAALPLNMYRRTSDGGKEKFLNNPLHRMVHDQPNPEMTAIGWRRTVQAHALTWGNGYSEIVRDGAGRPSQAWPITPDRVTPYRRGSDSGLEYRIVNRDGSDNFIPADDMLHIPGLGFDGIQGYSVIQKARESIGLGLAAERFGETFFGNGATFGGVIAYKGPKPPELSEKNYRDMLNSQHQGVDKAHKFLALYNDATYTRLGIPPNDAQFLETRTFQLAEVARWFNLPPHKIGDLHRATFSNIEQQTIDYYTGCLLPWLKTWEQELFLKLVPNLERNIQFFEHVVDGLLRGDSQMRADSFSKRFSTGSMTPNEIRDSENLNPIAGGDTAYVPLNTIPANLVQDWFKADIDAKKAKAEADRRLPPAPVAPAAPAADPSKVREIELLTEARDTARRCAQEAEDAKDVIAADLATVRTELAHLQAHRDALVADIATRDGKIEQLAQEVTLGHQVRAQLDTLGNESLLTIERLTAQATSLGTDLGSATRDLAEVLRMKDVVEADYQRVCGEKRDLEAARDAAIVLADGLEGERLTLKSQTEGLSLDVVVAQRETTQALERIATLEAEAQRSADARAREDEAHLADETALRSELGAVTHEQATAAMALLEATAKLADVEVAHRFDRGAWEAEAQRLTEARTHADEVNAATVVELRGQIATLGQELATSVSSTVTALTQIATLEATRETDRAALAEAQSDATRTADTVTGLQAQIAATQRSMQQVVTVVIRDLITRESDRARKAQSTPDKFGKWLESFYPLHEDFCRSALKPSVRALLTALGTDLEADRVLDRILPVYVGESTRQLRGVLTESDQESLGLNLERVLRRWESERAEALADRILKEAA